MKEFFIIFITLFTLIHTQKSLAEALGYSPTDKVVILNADDFGMCHSENLGTFNVLEYGLINSATLILGFMSLSPQKCEDIDGDLPT